MDEEIQLLQFLICERFQTQKRDGYLVEGLRSNIYVPQFPYTLDNLCVVTCWKKDSRFHKEVIEYAPEGGEIIKSPHMDIEPVTDQVIFRWHTHRFPKNLIISEPTKLWVRVILDWNVCFESYLLVESATQSHQK